MIFKIYILIVLIFCFSLKAQDFDLPSERIEIEKKVVQSKKLYEIGELNNNDKLSKMFENMTFEQIRKFYDSLPTNNTNSSIDKLVYEILRSQINLDKKSLNSKEDKKIFEIRINKLFEMGKFEDIDDFYSQIPIEVENEALNVKRIEAYLLRNEFQNSCKLHQRLNDRKSFEWGKLEIICSIIDQDFEKARLSLSLLKEFGIPGDTLFIDLAYKIIGDIELSDEEIYDKKLRDLRTLTPILLSSLQIAEISPSFENIKDSPINYLIFILSSPSASIEVKLYCAERLVRLKRIKPEILADVYQLSDFSNEEIEKVFELYKTFSPVRSRALIYQSIIAEKDPKIKFRLIQLLLNQSKKENLFKPIAILLRNSLKYEDLKFTDEEGKELVVDIFLGNGEYIKAKNYIKQNKNDSLLYMEHVLNLLKKIDQNFSESVDYGELKDTSTLSSKLPKKFIENFLIVELFYESGLNIAELNFTKKYIDQSVILTGELNLIDFIFLVDNKNQQKDLGFFKILFKLTNTRDIRDLSNIEVYAILKIFEYFENELIFKEISKDLLFSQL